MGSTPRPRIFCVDCFGPATLPPRTVRPAPHPGPRCATHHRAEVKRQAAARKRFLEKYPCRDCRLLVAAGQSRPIRPVCQWDSRRCLTCYRARRKVLKEARRAERDRRVYGLADGEYDRLYQAQGGRCGICLRATGKSRRLAVDHDHVGGRVRGILCSTCNSMIAHARDEPGFFGRAINYLAFPPAAAIGLDRIVPNPRKASE